MIYTLLGSCRRHGINPFDYLKDLFTRLPAAKITEIKEFTPAAWIKGCSAPAGTKTFLKVNGDQTAGVVLSHNNLLAAEQAAESDPDVPKDAVTMFGNVTKS